MLGSRNRLLDTSGAWGRDRREARLPAFHSRVREPMTVRTPMSVPGKRQRARWSPSHRELQRAGEADAAHGEELHGWLPPVEAKGLRGDPPADTSRENSHTRARGGHGELSELP